MENVCSDKLLTSAGFRQMILDADNLGLKLQIEVIKNKTKDSSE